MIKLYKFVDGLLHYHEAWISDKQVTEHWGVVGQTGETRDHAIDPAKTDEDNLHTVLSDALQRGLRPIEIADHHRLLIEYSVDDMGTKKDVQKRHRLEARMNETLGWAGLGFCDGGSIGSASMEVCCFVVDFDIAKRVITKDLSNTEFANFTRIYDEDAEA